MTRPVATTFLKFVKMPCAVSGRRYATEDASDIAPTLVWNMRLKSRGGVSEPGSPVAGDGMSCCSSSVASVKGFGSLTESSPCTPFFFFIFFAAFVASACMSSVSSSET